MNAKEDVNMRSQKKLDDKEHCGHNKECLFYSECREVLADHIK